MLALQGAFQEHGKILQELGVPTREVSERAGLTCVYAKMLDARGWSAFAPYIPSILKIGRTCRLPCHPCDERW